MKTFLITVPEGKERWFRTLFDQFHVKHRTLREDEMEDLGLARLMDEAMNEPGEAPMDEVMELLSGNAR